MPFVGDLMGNDKMVPGIDGRLYVVANHAGPSAAGRHRVGIRVGQRQLLVRLLLQLDLDFAEVFHLLAEFFKLFLDVQTSVTTIGGLRSVGRVQFL